jgi:hypothetical protein
MSLILLQVNPARTLVSMSVTSDPESEVCMPDKNDVAGSNDTVSFLMAAMSSERISFSGSPVG